MACQTWNDIWMICCRHCFDWDLDFDWASSKFAQKQIKLGQIEGTERDSSIRRKFEWCWKSNLRRQRKRYNNSSVSYHTTGYSFLTSCQNYRKVSRNSHKEGENKYLMLNDEHLQAFEDWKKALARTDVLTTPVFDGKMPFVIQADSSAHSVGACLAHEQPDGTERPIAFASFKLTPTQRNWSTIEREGYDYTVIFALRKFEIYVIGFSILIYTDHNPLQNVVRLQFEARQVDPMGTQTSEIQHFHNNLLFMQNAVVLMLFTDITSWLFI